MDPPAENEEPTQYHRADMVGNFHRNSSTWCLLQKDTSTAEMIAPQGTTPNKVSADRRIGFISMSNEQTTHMIECLTDPTIELHVSTDGTGKENLGGFGFIIYRNYYQKIPNANREETYTLCEGFGPADGFECNSTRVEIGGPLAVILLIWKISKQLEITPECHLWITPDNNTAQREGQW